MLYAGRRKKNKKQTRDKRRDCSSCSPACSSFPPNVFLQADKTVCALRPYCLDRCWSENRAEAGVFGSVCVCVCVGGECSSANENRTRSDERPCCPRTHGQVHMDGRTRTRPPLLLPLSLPAVRPAVGGERHEKHCTCVEGSAVLSSLLWSSLSPPPPACSASLRRGELS